MGSPTSRGAEALRILRAPPEARRAVAALVAEAYAPFGAHEPRGVWAAYVARSSDPALAWDGAETLAAMLDDALVGVVAFLPQLGRSGLGLPADWAGLRRLAVSPEARGRGIGSALIAACVDRARARGVASIGLHTAPELAAAIRLYQRMGFRRAPAHDCFASEELGFGPGLAPLWAFRRDLAAPAGR